MPSLAYINIISISAVIATTTVDVLPPPTSCLTTWTSDDVCNPIQKAVNDVSGPTIINLASGTYFNENFNTSSLENSVLVKIENKDDITIQAAPHVCTKSES